MKNNKLIYKIVLVVAVIFVIVIFLNYFSPRAITNLINMGKYNQAVTAASVCTKILPNNPKIYSLRAYANFKSENYKSAINDFDKAYRLENDEYKMMNFDNKIYVRYYTNDLLNAIKDFDQEINSTDDIYTKDSFLWDKAQFLYNIKKYEDSLKIYNQLLVNSENDSIYLLQNRLYYERAQVLKALGHQDKAAEDITKAKNLNLEEIFQNKIPEPKLIMESFEEDFSANSLE